MIIGSWAKLELGKQYTRTLRVWINGKLEWHTVPMVILREATYEEWLENLTARGGKQLLPDSNKGKFYEISVD